ncbi:MAG: PilZ domain-containing protein, partial [Treponema sp.]|nr:PilZ domain-containing protein [Treponema sp.]
INKCEILDSNTIFTSVTVLNKCMSLYMSGVRRTGNSLSLSDQLFVEKMNKLRAKIALGAENSQKIVNTRFMDVGQRITLIYEGKGIFSSKVLDNSDNNIAIDVPRQITKTPGLSNSKKVFVLSPDDWLNKHVSVYFWRKGDACYVFDTIVNDAGTSKAQSCLFIEHCNKLERTQKRQSIRAECQIEASLYLIKTKITFSDELIMSDAYKCVLEDLSEDGAMIRIGGKGKNKIHVKLSFNINSSPVEMYGIIKAVEYNRGMNQSRLHFECKKISVDMKNTVINYVYSTVSESEIERDIAIRRSWNQS